MARRLVMGQAVKRVPSTVVDVGWVVVMRTLVLSASFQLHL